MRKLIDKIKKAITETRTTKVRKHYHIVDEVLPCVTSYAVWDKDAIPNGSRNHTHQVEKTGNIRYTVGHTHKIKKLFGE